MGSSIVLKLLKVTHYYRNKKTKKWYLPFGYAAEDIDLNNVSLHIYQGEALGIIGEPGSSKKLIGRLLSGSIHPDKGKLVQSDHVYYGDIEDRKIVNQTVKDYVKHIVELFPYKVSDYKYDQVIQYAHLDEKQLVSQLTKKEFAQLLLSIARSSKSNIIILNHVLQYLDESFTNRAIELSNDYINHNQTIVFIDDDVDKIEQVSNYITWVSHGQIRMEGSLKQVIPVFKDHERDRKSIESKEELSSFDLDWKKSRTRMPEMTYNFKRIERYNHAKPPIFLVRFWTLMTSFLIGLALMGILLFNNLGIINISAGNQTPLQTQTKDTYENKLAYGIALKGSVKISGSNNLTLPKYSVVTIDGENSKNYRLNESGKSYTVAKSKLEYFNPAGLYEKHSFKTLSPYIKSNYSKYVEYFNSHLHKDHDTVKKSLVPEEDNRFVADVTSQPIKMIFNDDNQLNGFVMPIVNKSKLKDKFNINKDVWICKSGDGYFIADMKDNKWIYIEL
ncbi:ATP-binding cassette domain-containing protein [Staphylococcus pasteuri]|uniref:ATP-binding cassette domain-containing protein n=1 Tax=Staphylococcus pasteuri TaxID=45972 RepID=UPI0039AF4675